MFGITFHFGESSPLHAIVELLKAIKTQGERIMASQAELAAQVTAIKDKLTKIGAETRALLDKIDTLTDAIANGPAVTPELQAAVDAVTAQAQVVDDLNPDEPPPA